VYSTLVAFLSVSMGKLPPPGCNKTNPGRGVWWVFILLGPPPFYLHAPRSSTSREAITHKDT